VRGLNQPSDIGGYWGQSPIILTNIKKNSQSKKEDTMSDIKKCPVCGENIRATAAKCRFCKEDLEAYEKRREAQIEKTLYKGRNPMFYSIRQVIYLILLSIVFLLPGLIYFLYRWYNSKSNKYIITTHRLGIETGWLSIGGDNIELFRVEDLGTNTPLGMRIMGYSLLNLLSSDRTSKYIKIIIPADKQVELVEQIRKSIAEQIELNNIVIVQGEGAKR
jgi:rRNA maturation protein Nop10